MADCALPVRGKGEQTFDIVAQYHKHLQDNDDITKPVAAIEALVDLIDASDYTTVHETLETVNRHSEILCASVRNPVPLQAGTELFHRYLISKLKQQESETAVSGTNTSHHHSFEETLRGLVQHSRLYVDRAIAARDDVAQKGSKLVRDGETILTIGASRTVAKLLIQAAARYPADDVNFRVIYVRDTLQPAQNDRFVASLRGKGIKVSVISPLAVAHVMALRGEVNCVFVGAEAVSQSGGIISRLGTYQVAKLARENKPKLPVYVATETHKFVRPRRPLDQHKLGFKQQLLEFSSQESEQASLAPDAADAVDFTPQEYITNFITEHGVKLPGFVLEQLLDIYGTLKQ